MFPGFGLQSDADKLLDCSACFQLVPPSIKPHSFSSGVSPECCREMKRPLPFPTDTFHTHIHVHRHVLEADRCTNKRQFRPCHMVSFLALFQGVFLHRCRYNTYPMQECKQQNSFYSLLTMLYQGQKILNIWL